MGDARTGEETGCLPSGAPSGIAAAQNRQRNVRESGSRRTHRSRYGAVGPGVDLPFRPKRSVRRTRPVRPRSNPPRGERSSSTPALERGQSIPSPRPRLAFLPPGDGRRRGRGCRTGRYEAIHSAVAHRRRTRAVVGARETVEYLRNGDRSVFYDLGTDPDEQNARQDHPLSETCDRILETRSHARTERELVSAATGRFEEQEI